MPIPSKASPYDALAAGPPRTARRLPVSEPLLVAARNAFAAVGKRWRQVEESGAAVQFPMLREPTQEGLDLRQLQEAVGLLFGLKLSPEQGEILWEEAGVDLDGTVSYAELVSLLLPSLTTDALKEASLSFAILSYTFVTRASRMGVPVAGCVVGWRAPFLCLFVAAAAPWSPRWAHVTGE